MELCLLLHLYRMGVVLIRWYTAVAVLILAMHVQNLPTSRLGTYFLFKNSKLYLHKLYAVILISSSLNTDLSYKMGEGMSINPGVLS